MDPELLLALMQDPTMAQALAEMGVYGDKQALLGQQSKRGAGLYGTPGAEGRQVGNTYVASSPLEHLGVAAQRMLGAKQMNDATAGQQGLMAGDVNTRKALSAGLAEAMRRAKARQPFALDANAAPGAPGYDATAGIDDVNNYG